MFSLCLEVLWPAEKNRKINLTFGVFGVILSYLVIIFHIKWENNEKIFFGEKLFFRSKINILGENLKILRFSNFENLKILKTWKIIFSKSWFSVEKIFFHQKVFFSLFSYLIWKIITKYEDITPKTPKVRLVFRVFSAGHKTSKHKENNSLRGIFKHLESLMVEIMQIFF